VSSLCASREAGGRLMPRYTAQLSHPTEGGTIPAFRRW
jgi:hypothetical protein